jgi:GT2 family glycosyltransferase
LNCRDGALLEKESKRNDEVDLTISIVSGGDVPTVINCLRSLYQSLDDSISHETFLIDNAHGNLSTVLSEKFPQVTLITNSHMLGFAANHNQSLKMSRGRYCLILNDDTIINPYFCQALLAAAEKFPRAGLLGPRILNQDGTLQVSAFRLSTPLRAFYEALSLPKLFPNNRHFGDYRNWAHDTERDVESLMGAALLCRRAMWEQIGLLDEGFYMYSEDNDWCFRARNAGWKVIFIPSAVMHHSGGNSTTDMNTARQVETFRSIERFHKKHFGQTGLWLYRAFSLVRHSMLWFSSVVFKFRLPRQSWYRNSVLWTLRLLHEEGLQEIAARTVLLSHEELIDAGSSKRDK